MKNVSQILANIVGNIKQDTITFKTLRNENVFNNTTFDNVFDANEWATKNVLTTDLAIYKEMLLREGSYKEPLTLETILNSLIGYIGMESLMDIDLADNDIMTSIKLDYVKANIKANCERDFPTIKDYIDYIKD